MRFLSKPLTTALMCLLAAGSMSACSVGSGDEQGNTTFTSYTTQPTTTFTTSDGDGDGETSDSDHGDDDPGDGDDDTGDGDPDTGSGDVCGDGMVGPTESCDGSNLAGETCMSQGFTGGSLGCADDCNDFDVSGCVNSSCGNGVLDNGELCDGPELNGQTCESIGYAGGQLGCNPNCLSFNVSGCVESSCGDGVVNPGEACDGNNLNGQSCISQGYAGGSLALQWIVLRLQHRGLLRRRRRLLHDQRVRRLPGRRHHCLRVCVRCVLLRDRVGHVLCRRSDHRLRCRVLTVPRSLQLDLGDLKLAALAWGPADGRPVLASHGWLDNAATMTGLAPRLCEALPLQIVCLDLPGHGLSDHKRGPYHFIDWVADMVGAANALGWEKFSLLGHSMGAGISTLVAGTITDRIERAVLLEGLGPMTDEPEHAARRLTRALMVEGRKQDKQKRLFDAPETAAERLREAAKMSPESSRILIERGLVQVEGGWTWRADPRLRLESRMRMTEVQVGSFLTAIRCPVMLVEATQGWPHDAKLAEARYAKLPTLERVRVNGHHHVHLDDPEAVAAHVIPFFER